MQCEPEMDISHMIEGYLGEIMSSFWVGEITNESN
jgi:hypothetical protein